MAYTPTYDGDDTGSIIIDVIGKVLVAIGTLATIVGLVMAYRWMTGKKVM